MSLAGLDRLRRLQQLRDAPRNEVKESDSKEQEQEQPEVAPKRQSDDLLSRIDSFKRGFDSDDDDGHAEDEEEGDYDKTRIPDLDLGSLSGVNEGSVGSAMYPVKTVDAGVIAAECLSGEEVTSMGYELADAKSRDTEPIQIRSVGEVLKGYRERQRADEKQIQVRHARKVVAQPVHNKYVASDLKGPLGKRRSKTKRSKKVNRTDDEDKNALDYLDDGVDGYDDDQFDDSGPILLSNLKYTEFSSNYVMRGDMMKQCESILQNGRVLVLRTAPQEDSLDAKMLLRTMATDLAPCTASGYILPEILFDESSKTHEIRLESSR